MKWTRPVKVPFPSVWHRFQAKDLTGNQLVWYRVQDLPEDRFEDAIRHMCDYFARDELMNHAKGLAQDLVAMGDVVALWKAMLPDRMSLVCFREGSDEIVGGNILDVASRSDKDVARFNSAIFQAIYDTIDYVSHQANIFERYGVDHYLNAMGLSVDPKYRGRGIATEILRARIPLCRAVDLKLSATCFTGPNSQTAAARVGFQEDFTSTYAVSWCLTMGWQRPAEPAVPTVWYTFQAPDPDNDGQLATYRVEDLTEDRYDDMIQHYTDHFVDDEPFCENKKLSQDELSMAEIVGFWRWCFEKHMTVVCYKEGSDEIVGANLLHVKHVEDKDDWDVLQSKRILDIVHTNEYMTEQFNIFKHYNVDHYLTAYGLAINHRYRGRGIATEVLKARVPLCRALGIKVTATNFTAVGSQKAAEKAGFKNDFEVTYDDFAKMGPRYSFPGIKSKSLKLMSLQIE